jgi:hypothetical protein
VITVHSNLRGEERDETVQQLLSVEDRNNPTEIVIHVNMLKEGWDVTNLYTIVPLRAANSKTLVEQSIGRGLQLPYGKRVGVPAVDRLTIVSHDRFQEIIDEANNPNSIIRTGVVIGRDIPDKDMTVVQVATVMEDAPLPAQPFQSRNRCSILSVSKKWPEQPWVFSASLNDWLGRTKFIANVDVCSGATGRTQCCPG